MASGWAARVEGAARAGLAEDRARLAAQARADRRYRLALVASRGRFVDITEAERRAEDPPRVRRVPQVGAPR